MDAIEEFNKDKAQRIQALGSDEEMKKLSLQWLEKASEHKYIYNFDWLGIPIIHQPADIVAIQEIIWDKKPDVVIESGIAHGGGLLLYASILKILGKGKVIGVEIDWREHNKKRLDAHPLSDMIEIIEADCLSDEAHDKLKSMIKPEDKVMVVLDSHHTHEHVLKELELFHKYVSPGQLMILPDTLIEYLPKGFYPDRPWDVGDNPATAIREFLKSHPEFEVDKMRNDKLLITEGIDGYLIRKE